jgi:hypothetical protein
MLLNLIYLIFAYKVRFFKEKEANRQDQVNEIFMSICTFFFVMFTDFCPSLEIQYNHGGWGYCIFFAGCILFNLLLMLMIILRKF